MAGWVLDILVEYIVRLVMRLVQLVRSRRWPSVIASVTSSFHVKAGFGCDIVEISYEYQMDGKSYKGIYKRPILFSSLGKNHVEQLPRGTELIVRLKPGDPSISVMEKANPVKAEAANAQTE